MSDDGMNQKLNKEYGIASYKVEDSGKTQQEVLAEVNDVNYQGYGPDYRIGGRSKIVVGPLFDYERLLSELSSVQGLEGVPHREMVTEACPPDRIHCSIRHDVDADIRTSLAMAEMEHAHGIRTTYCILHTAPYYGFFRDGVFYRNGCLAHIYRRIQALGHEINLHSDGLHIYQEYKIDGAEAIRTEIDWLRQQGIDIVGTTAHNSASVYGAENYSIFKGRVYRLPMPSPEPNLKSTSKTEKSTPFEVIHDEKWAPLQVLDEAELGLTYEANDIFRQKHTPFEYGATRGLNIWRWNMHLNRRRINKDPRERWFYDQDRMIQDIKSMKPGQFLLLVVHPLYYGVRHKATSAPPLQINDQSVEVNDVLGWETYKPLVIQARSKVYNGKQEFQAINMSNAIGMLDSPQDMADQTNELRILLLGGSNLDGSSVGIPAQMHTLLSELLEKMIKRPVKIWKFASPGMGLTRYYSWYQSVEQEIKPHVVILGLGADEVMTSLPEYWSRQTGFSPRHPPGDYLHWDGENIELVKRSPGAAIRRGPQREIPQLSLTQPGLNLERKKKAIKITEYLKQCLDHFTASVQESGAIPMIMVQECGENIGLWQNESDLDKRKTGHAHFVEVVKAWVDFSTVPMIDPYLSFLNQSADLPTHWNSVCEWNYTGHRLAAEVAFSAFFDHEVL